MQFINNKPLFSACYQKLINTILAASPNTKIILQSEFPLSSTCTDFSEPAEKINGYINTINNWILEIAESNGLKYLDTISVLRDKDGYLKSEYDNGDGLHITAAGYTAIINYIRTHGYTE